MKVKINVKLTLRILYGVLAFLIVSVVGLFIFRNQILHYLVDGKIARMESAYDLRIRYSRLQFNGLSEIDLDSFSIVPNNRDTLLNLQSMKVKFDFLPLLIGDVQLDDMSLDKMKLTFVKRDSISNYDFLFKKKNQSNETHRRGFDDRVNSILNMVYDYLPVNGTLRDIYISKQKDDRILAMHIPIFSIADNQFDNTIDISEDGAAPQRIHTTGELSHWSETLDVRVTSAQPMTKIVVPYLEKHLHAQVSFSALNFKMKKKKFFGNLSLNGKMMIEGLDIFHKALSPEVVHIDKGSMEYKLNVGANYVELDSTETTAQFNKLMFNPYVRAEKNVKWHFTVSVDKPWFPSDDLFTSLPQGLFDNLKGIRSRGDFAYHFLLDIDLANLNRLKLESSLRQRNFSILSYGSSDLTRMNREFVYTAYNNGKPVRSFPIGRSWDHFTPFDSIPQILQWAVLESEDGTFFKHRGFRMDMLRSALIDDIQKKKFARGGSTISMQIIKNVFLNRNKNIARKLEEALIVWLIENEHITSKQRLLEVYFNIAEWGPDVYGIYEAADFYFNKRPWQLSLEECICLASIIPKPKHYTSFFTVDKETGQVRLRGYMGNYYKLIARLMAIRGIISRSEADSVYPYVNLSGRARQAFTIHRTDTLSNDSITLEEILQNNATVPGGEKEIPDSNEPGEVPVQ